MARLECGSSINNGFAGEMITRLLPAPHKGGCEANFPEHFMAGMKCLYSHHPARTRQLKANVRRADNATVHHLTITAMFDPEKDRLHAINHRLDQLRGYL
jgi:hypothetical protein